MKILKGWLLASLLLLTACQQISPEVPAETFSRIDGATMGTTYHIVWRDQAAKKDAPEQQSKQAAEQANDVHKRQIKDRVDALLVAINKSMSTYDRKSELSQLNQKWAQQASSLGQWQNISLDLYRVLWYSLSIFKSSQGFFDVTVGPAVNLWGFGPEHQLDKVPDAVKVAETQKIVGAGVLDIRLRDEGYQVKTTAQRYVDLSAVAKGYAVDQVVELLQKQGLQHFLVEIGGELRAAGNKGVAGHWRVAIEKPDQLGQVEQKIIELNDVALATSGDYRNYFMQDGKRYAHTIDAFTAKPVVHDTASVSVIMKDTAQADAWATALLAMGADKGLKLAQQQNLAVMFIIRKHQGDSIVYQEVISDGFNQYLQD